MQVLNAIAHQWTGDKRTEFERFAASLSEAVNTALTRAKPEADITNAATDAAGHLVGLIPAHADGQSLNGNAGRTDQASDKGDCVATRCKVSDKHNHSDKADKR